MARRFLICLPLPDPIRQEIKVIQEMLAKRFNKYEVELLDNDFLNIPLNKSGRVKNPEVYPASQALAQTVAGEYVFEVQPFEVEVQYNRREPSDIYISLHDDLELKTLFKNISKSWQALNIPQPIRYTPTIPIGKVLKSAPPLVKRINDQIRDMTFPSVSNWQATDVAMWEILGTKKTIYQPSGKYSLTLRHL
jgi:2'-5' RNA ligase